MTTFVLIHGSYQGGWIWQRVASRLRAAGHTVYAPTLDGCAERKHQVRAGITTETHAAEIAEILFYEDLNHVVMVGTSSGGWALERYTLHPIGIYEHPVRLQSFWTQPWAATVIWCRRAVNPGEAHQRRTADRLKANWFELDTNHYPMLSMPDELSGLLTS